MASDFTGDFHPIWHPHCHLKQYRWSPSSSSPVSSLNTNIGSSLSDIYLVVNDIGTSSGEGLDFINGYAFLERLYKWFYSAFDTGNNRVGFAATSYTDATTN
ncbi:hypothetical protein SCP_0311360 [Sparassis crispa]|uniref:Peptidase A1 domain-containing protein n=1 Tax=Sparassis crispa TaxID=139825 RepID=A0A401GGU6_9APHY|nr:hypothetical protein SCP_0311360 [Sparassis crispa]GBE81407.1 hypothetical protein SCP_0311360 [Sparassis crispa]